MAITEAHLLQLGDLARPGEAGNVVFVHGLNGDPRRTWETSLVDDNGVAPLFWPECLARAIPNIGVWSLGYPAYSTQWRGDAMALPQRAKNVLEIFRLKGLSQYPVVFVTHSLGGLLVKAVLRTALTSGRTDWESFAKVVRGILFFATPHRGSFLACVHNVFRIVARSNETITDLQHQSPYLEELNDWFRLNFEKLGLKGHVLREGRKTSGVFVVDRGSADPGIPSVPVIDTDADHVSICKPTALDSLIYQTTVDFVRGCLASREATFEAAKKAESPDPVGCLIDISAARGPQSWTLHSEVRFSVTNSTARRMKVPALLLEVLEGIPLARTMGTTTAGPIDETVLFAKISPASKIISILPRLHVIEPSGTDGFFLKILAEEGYTYRLRIIVEWRFLGDDTNNTRRTCSKDFVIEHPVHSVEGLLRLTQQRHRT